jgi:hypothetical protein
MARNKKVAINSELLIAFTFGRGDIPGSSGTLNTWNQCKGQKRHFCIHSL